MAQGVIVDEKGQIYCKKCQRTLSAVKFYTYKDKSKCEICKDCLTMHINTYNEEDYLWLIQKFDAPYVPNEWKRTREKEFEKAYAKAAVAGGKDPKTAAYNMTKGNGVVFGKYLSKMKIKPWLNYSWADSERLQAKLDEEAKRLGAPTEEFEQLIEEKRQAYAEGKISEAEYMTYASITASDEKEHIKSLEEAFLDGGNPDEGSFTQGGGVNPYPVNDSPFEKVTLPEITLTEEQKILYATKWGRLYSAADWLYLEKKYKDFMNSFDIQGAARIDTLIQICKLSLKMNQSIDTGDTDSYSKYSRAYDILMKSAKFTEAQRKEERSGDFDAVGQVVYFAEKVKGPIKRYHVDELYPLDIVDKAIVDLKHYNHELVINDPTLSQMFENLIKRRENAEAMKRDAKEAEESGVEIEISDKDYEEFNKILEEKEEDE